MYISKLFIVLYPFFIFFFLAQEVGIRQKKEFDSIFYDVAVRISALDMTRAEKVADSLYRGSKTEIQKVKSLMLLADLLEKQGRRNEAIEYALKAEELASANLNYQWMARFMVFWLLSIE